MLDGFGVHVSYGRLREACQTDVDGTSIDTMEEVGRQLGLDAEQILIPIDHVLLEEAAALPAILVVRLANGLTHFLIVWRRHGRWLQLMDPAVGRRPRPVPGPAGDVPGSDRRRAWCGLVPAGHRNSTFAG